MNRLLALFGLFCAPVFCQDVQVMLSLENGKTVYRSGEAIRLLLTFTAQHGGSGLNENPSKSAVMEDISISPETGVAHWADEFWGGARRAPDGIHMVTVGPSPVTIDVALNDFLRVDGPDAYIVRITTRRTGVALTTNPVTFTVTPMTNDEAQAERERLTAAIAEARRPIPGRDRTASMEADGRQRRLEEELSYLDDDASTREKLRVFLLPGRPNEEALFMASNRSLVLDTLEKAIADPAVPPTQQLFHAVVRLRTLSPNPGQAANVEQAIEAELIASLPRRSGRSRSSALNVIFDNLPKEHDQAAAMLAGARETLIVDFDKVHPARMLAEYWDLFRDPRLIGGIEAIVSRGWLPAVEPAYLQALQRLIELAPDRARPFVVAQVESPKSVGDFQKFAAMLAEFPDTRLPEVDAPLLAIIREQAPLDKRTFQLLAQKTALAARFATDALYDPMLEIYRTSGAKWQAEERAGMLSYLARVREQETMPLIEREVASLGPWQDSQFFDYLMAGTNSAGIHALLRKRLESSDPNVAVGAARSMAAHGVAGDQALLEKRLAQWRDEWKNRPSNAAPMLEVGLFTALSHSAAWTLTADQLQSLRADCLTEPCRRQR